VEAPILPATATRRTTRLAPDSASEALTNIIKVEENADATLVEGASKPENLFKSLKLEAKDIDVVGSYIQATAEVGSTLLEIAQARTMNII
ncbi:hypothetical protein FRC00_005307, partial [Tulasnella sp. 408]